jgi:transposase
MNPDRIVMSRRDRDTLTVLRPVLAGQRTQAEAARLLGKSTRQVRRLVARLQAEGDAGLIQRPRGRPSNRQIITTTKNDILSFYAEHLQGFGPTLAAEALAEQGLDVGVETLRRWLTAEGLWVPAARRAVHRSRRPRRTCFGERVQLDASEHDWTEGRGEPMVLLAMIDDATSRITARFAPAGTTAGYFDLLERWLHAYGRPVALSSDKKSVFRVPTTDGPAPPTRFGRACAELGIELIWAHSPQAKGRIERSFGTAQDRWVKRMRAAGVASREQANAPVGRVLQPRFNRRFTAAAADAHRPWDRRVHDLRAILGHQEPRTVSDDYVVRSDGRLYPLARPALPGLRGVVVVVAAGLDGRLAIRFKDEYLRYHEIARSPRARSSPRPPEPRTGGVRRPAADHPWREAFQTPKNG